MVKPTHLGSSLDIGIHVFSGIIPWSNDVILSVIGNVPIDNETYVMALSKLSFSEVLIGRKFCVLHAFLRKLSLVCIVSICVYTM